MLFFILFDKFRHYRHLRGVTWERAMDIWKQKMLKSVYAFCSDFSGFSVVFFILRYHRIVCLIQTWVTLNRMRECAGCSNFFPFSHAIGTCSCGAKQIIIHSFLFTFIAAYVIHWFVFFLITFVIATIITLLANGYAHIIVGIIAQMW